jgi:hypothetical protein
MYLDELNDENEAGAKDVGPHAAYHLVAQL